MLALAGQAAPLARAGRTPLKGDLVRAAVRALPEAG